jgi:phosphoribosylformylglycinamidine synthase
MLFEVVVQLKPEVLDPEARAITETLHRLGMPQVKKVQVAKRYLLEVETPSEQETFKQVEMIAQEYLANPVAETFQVNYPALKGGAC